jgi:8-oxo-dGTP pyrophosphatase MutT (NUDIX family)
MSQAAQRWDALRAARAASLPRTAFHIDGHSVGSVATTELASLHRWPQWLAQDARGLNLLAPQPQRDAALAQINTTLRGEGRIVAWRDETYAIVAAPGEPPLALIERASARFWGTLTFGAHANGYVADSQGRPTHLWIARRALSKATDPGKLDNLVGGGVPHGQTPWAALLREGFEEAGLDELTLRGAVPASVIELRCDIAEGFMHEWLYTFDLRLPPDVQPVNQDGEVAEHRCLTVAEALETAAAGAMTTDAALVTLDFALRHRLLGGTDTAWLSAPLEALRIRDCPQVR